MDDLDGGPDAAHNASSSYLPRDQLPRGRQPKDPLLQTARYQCSSLEEFEQSLRAYFDDPPTSAEHSTCELTIWAGASFLVTESSARQSQSQSQPQAHTQTQSMAPSATKPIVQLPPGVTHSVSAEKKPLSIMEALIPTSDPKDTQKKQKAIAKTIVDSIQKVDGYRYAFHNNWRSGEEGAYRFSYYCNDSLLNKDRVANGRNGVAGKRATKPVYDCKGILAVKFSAPKQCVEVTYKHIPIHATYEERAPIPRKESRRRAHWEMSHPEK
ncbi:hypothetical protein K402DRAFT_69984 [Aulographum hederae CBS 113979]|uniref:Uncharacterized protein n=1 Tax=Aulographum hederae CBS 113979 TaxID=1176131 RepID=A0A6G1HF64_9PEZI|nr:hypothetical protein K402DRAFT_69984 [Aulographum hederae CBS 113979]